MTGQLQDTTPQTWVAIEERNPLNLVDLFQGMPGVRVIPHGLQRAITLTGSRVGSRARLASHLDEDRLETVRPAPKCCDANPCKGRLP